MQKANQQASMWNSTSNIPADQQTNMTPEEKQENSLVTKLRQLAEQQKNTDLNKILDAFQGSKEEKTGDK
jgi:hypothetical protein